MWVLRVVSMAEWPRIAWAVFMDSPESPEQTRGVSPGHHPILLGFDTFQEYLVNCQVAMIGNGALPCILVENF